MKRMLLTLCVAAGALACAQSAQAGSQTLSATYFSVPNGGAGTPDPDFQVDPLHHPEYHAGQLARPQRLAGRHEPCRRQ